MAMLRALSVRRSNRRYERLVDGEQVHDEEVNLLGISTLPRSTSVPAARLFGSKSRKLTPEFVKLPSKNSSNSSQVKSEPKKSKSHPLFSLFDGRKRRSSKTTAKPEFARYLEYVKEGGVWDPKSNGPAMYYK